RPARTARRRSSILVVHGAKVTALVPALGDLPDQREQVLRRTAGGAADQIKCNLYFDDPVVSQHGLMFGEDVQWPVVLRADDADLGLEPRIGTPIGYDVEAVADAFQVLNGKPCFQPPDWCSGYDSNTVKTQSKLA